MDSHIAIIARRSAAIEAMKETTSNIDLLSI
jgi:hypothetical protein